MLGGKSCHSRLTQNATVFGEEVRQCNATVPPRHAISQNAIQKGLGIGAGHVVFGEASEIDEPTGADRINEIRDINEAYGTSEIVLDP